MKRHINTNALNHIIQNTELHNRMKEEQKMWLQKRKVERKVTSKDNTQISRKRAHISYESSDEGNKNERRNKKKKKSKKKKKDSKVISSDTPVTAHLEQKQERWGHSGFMELYSDEVISGKYFQDSHDKLYSSNSDSDVAFSKECTKKRKKKKKKEKKRKKHKH